MPTATLNPHKARPQTAAQRRRRGRAAVADRVLNVLRTAGAHNRGGAMTDGQIAERAGCRVADVAAACFALQKAGHLIVRDPRDRRAGRWLVQPVQGAELVDGIEAGTRYANALRARARKLEAQRSAVLDAIAATREAAAGRNQLTMFTPESEAP